MRSRFVAVAVIVLMALAGCAGPSPEATAAENEVTGVLRGVVVDEVIQPEPGVDVVLMPGNLRNVTDSEGRFAFSVPGSGVYTVTASKSGFSATSIIATYDMDASESVTIVLPADPADQAFVSTYKFSGMFECGVFPVACSNINIATWVVLCSYGICLGNLTTDSALFLQWLDAPPLHLQSELVWDSTQPLGDSLGFAIGGATEEQLSTGGATTNNYTFGGSPLMLTVGGADLVESQIGVDRALLTQVVSAPASDIPGGCVFYNPCGPGVQLMQPFETFTHAFYGFIPELGWRFTNDGAPDTP